MISLLISALNNSRIFFRMFGGKLIDWESVSLEEWLSAFEEVLNNFDPSDPECQKRLICEIHQNTRELGPGARTTAYLFR